MITVLMAVFDTPASLLDKAIGSILDQSERDFEFLIVDDGSRAYETREVLERASQDDRVRIAWEPHRGLTGSLNRGLALASGDLIARQDADDWSEPRRLEKQKELFLCEPDTVLCGTNAWTHQQNGTRLWPTRLPASHAEIAEVLRRGNPFVHGSAMFRAQAARGAGGYREEFRCSQDYDFFWRLSEAGGVTNLSENLYHYRYGDASISARRAGEQLCAHRAAQILARQRGAGVPEDVEAALAEAGREAKAPRRQLQVALKQADHLMLAGEYGQAARTYASLLAGHPTSRVAWGKLLRWGLFAAVPGMRETCFR